jgi:hypothetical protein
MGLIHSSFAYQPPSYSPIKGVKKFESISYLIQNAGEGERKLRIFYFHGNSDDISTTNDEVGWVIDKIAEETPGWEISCVLIDYPTFGMSENSPYLLGTGLLDDQIGRLFEHLKGGDINITWSQSMGTRYNAALIRTSNVDFGYFQEPFYSISTSCTLPFSGYYTGLKGDGISLLQKKENILLHVCEGDTKLPPSLSLDKMSPFCEKIIVEEGKYHGWFLTYPEGCFRTVEVLGKEIKQLISMHEIVHSMVESSLENPSPSSSSPPSVVKESSSPPEDTPPSSSSSSSPPEDDSPPKLMCSLISETSDPVES